METSTRKPLLCLCEHAEAHLSPSALPRGFPTRTVPGLCREPARLKSALGPTPPPGLVLALCTPPVPRVEVETAVRRAGLDPFAVEVVGVPPAPGDPERWRALLEARLARVEAFPGAGPRNRRAVLEEGPVSRRALFTLPPMVYDPVPSIQRERCRAPDGCDRCVTVCPFGALDLNEGRVQVEGRRCRSCGLCVPACPSRAVLFPTASAEEVEAEVNALLGRGVGIAFVCRRKGTLDPGEGWVAVPVPCTGTVPSSALMASLALGVPAVALLGCGEGCIARQAPSARQRVGFVEALLEQGGQSGRALLAEEAPLPVPPAPPEATPPEGPLPLYGAGADASALLALARRLGLDGETLEHPGAPVGRVRVDPERCTLCEACSLCPTGALSVERETNGLRLVLDPLLCNACGVCAQVCPEEGAVRVERVADLRFLQGGRRTVVESEEARCERCGAPIASRRMLDRLASLLGDQFDPVRMARLCNDCRGLTSLRPS